MKGKLWSVVAMLSIATPVLAHAADGYVVDNVNLRAGPDASYPLVDQLPAGTEVGVQGCTDGWEWCDVLADGNRGWIAGNYIQYEYQDQPVFLSDYGAQIGIPIVAFSIGTYWDRYYRGRPFYGDRDHWYNQPYVRRAPPPPPRGYTGRPGNPGSWHGPDYGHGGDYNGPPGSGYQRPGHLGPVSPGYPVSQFPNGRQMTPQPGQGQVGRPVNGQFTPGQPNGRSQPPVRPNDSRTGGRPDDHNGNDHPDNSGH